ncbi:hypothetical protein [Phenylobacterium sp.]|uniref:hypothetical protein n=1 Tax=Phenylobacterium sp. TaxID=1871053 RepID=UPI0027304E00|nr:hypothetical protein [Phenylobacterium sp.]MDP1874155.1 hypothetical protein [Phenylobacterium sp.]
MRLRIVLPVGAAAAALLLSACSRSTTSLLCKGTVQEVGKPETLVPVDALAASVTKHPFYVTAWSKSYGEFRLTEPYAQYYSDLDDLGDQIIISELGSKDSSGIFNKISGRLMLHAGSDLFEVSCKDVARLMP